MHGFSCYDLIPVAIIRDYNQVEYDIWDILSWIVDDSSTSKNMERKTYRKQSSMRQYWVNHEAKKIQVVSGIKFHQCVNFSALFMPRRYEMYGNIFI